MVDHGIRDHATWSASSTARNWQCAGALTLAQFAPPDKESIHTARGTAAHQISEKCLRSGQDAIDFLGTVESTKEFQIEIDEELVNSAQMYVDYVRHACVDTIHPLWVEERFSLSELGTPFDAGGTGDAIIYNPDLKSLEIVDLKNGMGLVDAKENPQLRTYALGALLAHQDLDVNTVTATIVQPRPNGGLSGDVQWIKQDDGSFRSADGLLWVSKDKKIRSETFHVADLIAWTADLLKAMGRSKEAMNAFEKAKDNSVLMDDWVDTWLKPGKCTFCPVEATCPALRRQALAVAATYFEPETGEAKIGNLPTEMSPEKLAETLDMLDMLENWIKAVRAFAHTSAENGVSIPGYQLVEKIGNRKWKDDESALAVSLLSPDVGLSEDEIYDRKLRSVAQLEKVLGAKRKGLIEHLWERPITGTNLVSQAKSTRPATKSKVETFFEQQN